MIDSCFLPGTHIQYAWDSTSLGYLKVCPRLYQYIMVEGWGGDRDENIHLRFGIEYHTGLQDYAKHRAAGKNHEQALQQTVLDLLCRTYGWEPDRDTRAGKYKNRESLVRTVIWYLENFINDSAEVVILETGQPAVELSFRFELDWGPTAAMQPEPIEGNEDGHLGMFAAQPYLLCGHLDSVRNFQDALFVMDHKTTLSTPGDYFFDQFSPHNQMSLYSFASQVVIDSPVKGVIINAAQLLVDESKFYRGITYRTPGQILEWVGDLKYWFSLAEQYATANYWPMNDTSCDKYGGCTFREVCSKDPGVRQIYLKGKFKQLPEEERWNPLRPR